MNPVARLMNSFDPTKLTPEHRALAKEIGSHVDAAFRRAKEAHLMQSEEIAETETCSKKLPEGIANPPMNEMLAPERLAELFAERRGQTFSRDQLATLLEDNSVPADWTYEQALAVWYSLENLEIAVAGWAAYRDWSKVCRISSVDNGVMADVATFASCQNGTEMFTFFGRYLNRIFGKPETVTIGHECWDNPSDPISAAAICSQFVGACVSTRRLLDHCPVDWTRPRPKPPQDVNSGELHELLIALGACREFLTSSAGKSLLQLWQECERADWMLWLCGKMMNNSGWPSRSELVLAACSCAETVLPLYENKRSGQSDPRTAIDIARAWAHGKASLEEVRRAVAALDTILMFINLPMAANNAAVAAHDAAAAAIATYSDETASNAARAAVNAEAGLLIFNRTKIHKGLARLIRQQLRIGC
jgi:hypothetical protein